MDYVVQIEHIDGTITDPWGHIFGALGDAHLYAAQMLSEMLENPQTYADSVFAVRVWEKRERQTYVYLEYDV